jgi:hypothetical protein
VSDGNGEYFDPGHGRLMKEWVTIGAGKVSWVELAKEAYPLREGRQAVRALGRYVRRPSLGKIARVSPTETRL